MLLPSTPCNVSTQDILTLETKPTKVGVIRDEFDVRIKIHLILLRKIKEK